MICGQQRRSALFGEVILLPLLVFEPPTPIMYLSHTTDINPFTPNDLYRSRTALLTSKVIILYIYLTNIGTEHFKHGIYSPFLSLRNAVCFIILTHFVPVLFTFYIQSEQKVRKKKSNSGAKRLRTQYQNCSLIPFMLSTATQKALHKINFCAYISQADFARIATFCFDFKLCSWWCQLCLVTRVVFNLVV